MPKRIKFRPEISRIKLNPEQVALICSCYSDGWRTILYCPYIPNGVTAGCPGDAAGPLPAPTGKSIWASVGRSSSSATS